MSNVPWPTVRLEEVANEITVGYVGPMVHEYCPSGIPFLRSQNVRRFRIDQSGIRFIGPEFHARLSKSRLTPGDVVIVRTGEPGAAAMVPEWLPEANCADLVIVRPGPRLEAQYLVYFLNSTASQHIEAYTVGAVQQHFNVGSAKRLPLPLPSMDEQQAIVKVLGALDDKIELNREMNHTLEAMADAIFKSWFVDFDPVQAKVSGRGPFGMDAETAASFPELFIDSETGPIPQGWQVGAIGEIGENTRDQVRPAAVPPETPYIGLTHMPRESISLADWGKASDTESGKFRFRQGEILFGKLRPYFHKVGVAVIDGVCSTDVVVIRPQRPEWFGVLLGHVSSAEFVGYVDAASHGTRMPRTDWHTMARYQIALPPKATAQVYSRMLSEFVAMISSNIHQTRTLAALRDTLLPKLMSGAMRIKKAEGEVEEALA